jgi:putative transcriptional regulator
MVALPVKNRIKALREAIRLPQRELAQSVGVTRQSIHAIESGKHDPSVTLAFRIANQLGRPIQEVFDVASIEEL